MRSSIILIILCFFVLNLAGEALAERIFFAGYKGGFYLKSEEEGGIELRLGGAFQADYRHFGETVRADDRFDIRRARLVFNGQLTQWFRFGLEYEFEGNEVRNLVNAYGEAIIDGLTAVRFGQFKAPFSLEWQTRDKGHFFAERSMGYDLTPKRDIGLMAHGSIYQDTFNYALGLFNGDGVDGSVSGDEYDEPEIMGRFVFAPFKTTALDLLKHFQIGGSATYARIDLSNVNLEVRSTGMAGSSRSLYVLKQNTKFGVLQDVGNRIRYGFEAGWTWKSLAFQGEYMYLKYTDIKPAGNPAQDAEFSSWYVSASYFLTGERPVLTGGTMKPVHPDTFFNPMEGTFGAFCLSARAEHFDGDREWIKDDAFVSVENADAFSVAVNWILFPMFSDPIRVRVNIDGSVDYIEKENVLTFRFSMDF